MTHPVHLPIPSLTHMVQTVVDVAASVFIIIITRLTDVAFIPPVAVIGCLKSLSIPMMRAMASKSVFANEQGMVFKQYRGGGTFCIKKMLSSNSFNPF